MRILSLAMLYIFLGIAIWMLWRAVSAKEASAGRIAIPSISLVTDEDGKREELSFTSQEVSIGRSPESDFRLDNHTVSARHGRLNYHLNQWWYEDLNSTNGSFLQGMRIEEPIVLKDGDEIAFGEVYVSVFIKPVDKTK
ncbi:MAG: FHA domain-containing protein [Chloroflexi bacterium]|nr:FHA domain-containing protein [Chloroflexota bacterium]